MNRKIAPIRIAEDIDWKKVISDLNSLDSFKSFAKNNNWRMVVSGGYSLDLFLHLTTRTHNDVDLIIYGQEDKINAIKKIGYYMHQKFDDAAFIAQNEVLFTIFGVHSQKFGANIYFIETVEDPFKNHRKIKKPDGQIIAVSDKELPKPTRGKIGEFEFEIEDQNAHMADILRKYKTTKLPTKYIQDLDNLKHIIDPSRVEVLLHLN